MKATSLGGFQPSPPLPEGSIGHWGFPVPAGHNQKDQKTFLAFTLSNSDSTGGRDTTAICDLKRSPARCQPGDPRDPELKQPCSPGSRPPLLPGRCTKELHCLCRAASQGEWPCRKRASPDSKVNASLSVGEGPGLVGTCQKTGGKPECTEINLLCSLAPP